MQQQVMKRNTPDMGLGIGESGGWGQQLSALGSGSWTSTASQDTSSSNWQGLGKADSTSDAGDDTSSIKSGSTVTNAGNVNPQSQDSSTISTSAVSSSSPWSANPSLSGMDSGPWGNSSSPAPTSMSLGWNSNPSINQTQNNSLPQGPSAIGSNLNFGSTSSASSGWPSGSMASGMPPNVNSGMTSGNISSQWPASSMLGKMDFPKTDSAWNNPTSSLLENKDIVGSDPRWGMVDKPVDQNWEPPKSQWGNNPIGGAGDQGASNGADNLSFAQATLKGLKMPPNGPTGDHRSKSDDILRAIENHEGWGSRPIRQDTSWDVETSPKSQRKFQTDNNSGASNVWNNSNGTAIWEAVRENQGQGGGSSWNGGNGNNAGNNWNADKDQQGWQGGPKPQDPSQWGVPGGNVNDSKSFGTWDNGGAGDASNKMYGQKSGIGSWSGDMPNVQQRPTNISSWQDEGDNNNWEDPRRSITGAMSSMQNMVPPSPGPVTGMSGGMAGMMPQGMAGIGADPTPWNASNPAALNRTKIDEPWNTSKPPPTKMPGSNGWGMVESDQKVDDGTGIWAANIPKMPKQAGAGGWGNEMPPQGQWNPKQMPPSSGWDEHSYMMAQRNKQQMPPNKFNSSSQPPPQMRAKALQQLMDMGFKKEEAQQALIGNNMDIGCAINELKSSSGMQRKDFDMDMYQGNAPQSSRMPPYMPKDMNDAQSEQVPNFNTNLPNTPFPNAQLSSQPFIQGNTRMPPSSLNPNTSINNPQLQQKLMEKIQQVPPGVMGPRGQMPPVGGANNNQALQQQQQQQQILSQLRQAVNNGYISPQLLNNPLPHNILVLLQQLLQLQQAKQGVVSKLNQSKNSPIRSPQVQQQLDQLPQLINNINTQINGLQKQLQQAQNNFFSTQDSSKMPPRGIPPNMSQQPPSGMMTPVPGHQQSGDNIDGMSADLASVSINPPQSRLTNIWKAESSDGSSTPITTSAAMSEAEDKSKGLLQSSTSPSLTLFGDRTWSSMSTTSSSNWPMSSTDSAGTNSLAEPKSSMSSNTPTSSATAAGMSSSGLADMVPEFVPGKPWQGYTKNVEDDPHVTPGSMIQRSLSVNKVHDESLSNLSDGHKITGNMGGGIKNENTMFGHLGNRPPPNMAPGKMVTGGQQWQNNYQRQNTWGGRSNTSAFTQVGNQNWNDQSNHSSWILLKHPNSSLDSTTLKALCGQHGNLINYFPQGQAALVQFSSRDQAFNAVQRMNNFQVGNTVIMAEMIGENEAQRAVSQNPPPHPSSTMPPINPSQWSHAPPTFPSGGGMRNNDPWGNQQMPGHQSMSKYGSVGGDPWGGSGLWGDMNPMGDHNSSQMLNNMNNILGSESM